MTLKPYLEDKVSVRVFSTRRWQVGLQVERDHEEERETCAGVDMSSYVLVVECDVNPGASAT